MPQPWRHRHGPGADLRQVATFQPLEPQDINRLRPTLAIRQHGFRRRQPGNVKERNKGRGGACQLSAILETEDEVAGRPFV